MMWFGKSWGAPVCTVEEHTETPVGKLCSHCTEAIEAGDQGIIMQSELLFLPQHLKCFLRSVYGSAGHILRRCSCYVKNGNGTPVDDPPNFTKRESAEVAVQLYELIAKLFGEEVAS